MKRKPLIIDMIKLHNKDFIQQYKYFLMDQISI